MCLGAKFAMQEATLALLVLLHRMKFHLAGPLQGLRGQEAMSQLPIAPDLVLKPRQGVPVTIVQKA